MSKVDRRLAHRALANLDTVTERSRSVLTENSAFLSTFVDSRDDLEGVLFPGSTFAFLSHRSQSGNEISDAVLEAGVLVVPGRFFHRPERFRISLGGDPGRMRAGLDAFTSVLDSMGGGGESDAAVEPSDQDST